MELTLDILGHADFMGRIRKSNLSPGLAAFSATVESVRELNPEGTLLLGRSSCSRRTKFAGHGCHDPR